jgi:hypothetical protein
MINFWSFWPSPTGGVQAMKGLYLAAPLSENLSKYAMFTNMKAMIENFQCCIGLHLHLYSKDDYGNILNK